MSRFGHLKSFAEHNFAAPQEEEKKEHAAAQHRGSNALELEELSDCSGEVPDENEDE